MAIAQFSTLLDLVMPDIPGCSDQYAISNIRDAAIEFCEKSDIYQYEHQPVSTSAGVAVYQFSPPQDTVVSKVIQAWYDDVRILPFSKGELETFYPNWMELSGKPLHYTQPDERSVRLVPVPDAGISGGLRMLVSLKPTRSAQGIEERILDEYRDAIVDGAKARLMMSPGKPYTNVELGVALDSRFRKACAQAKALSASFTTPPIHLEWRFL